MMTSRGNDHSRRLLRAASVPDSVPRGYRGSPRVRVLARRLRAVPVVRVDSSAFDARVARLARAIPTVDARGALRCASVVPPPSGGFRRTAPRNEFKNSASAVQTGIVAAPRRVVVLGRPRAAALRRRAGSCPRASGSARALRLPPRTRRRRRRLPSRTRRRRALPAARARGHRRRRPPPPRAAPKSSASSSPSSPSPSRCR